MMLLGTPYTDENGQVDDHLLREVINPDYLENLMIWLDEHVEPAEEFNHEYSSLKLQEIINKDLGSIFTHNQIKDAINNLDLFPEDPDSFEWYYKVKVTWPERRSSNHVWLEK